MRQVYRKAPICIMLMLALMACIGCYSSGTAEEATLDEQEDVMGAVPESGPKSEPEGTVTLGFVGDISLADNYLAMQRLAEMGSTDITDGIDYHFVNEMRTVDIMWVNNEFTYGTDVEPLEGKMYTFLAAPENVKYLDDMGVDIVGLANNHAYDYGEEAFLTTLDVLEEAGIPYVGAGRNIQEASSPVIIEVNGVKVAYVAASCAEYTIYTPEAGEDTPGIMWCYDDELFLEEIRSAAEQADYVVALPHWGMEHTTELDAKQLASGPAYIDAGADIVIGVHAHNLQGIDYYQGKPILYNLGNFWFDAWDEDTVMVKLTVTVEEGAEPVADVMLLPGTQSEIFTSWAPNVEERNRIFRLIEYISLGAITIDANGHVSPA